MVFDTQSENSNWISPLIFAQLHLKATKLDQKDQKNFRDASNNLIKATEKTTVKFQGMDDSGSVTGKEHTADFFVAPRNAPFQILLGAKDILSLGILPAVVLPAEEDHLLAIYAEDPTPGMLPLMVLLSFRRHI